MDQPRSTVAPASHNWKSRSSASCALWLSGQGREPPRPRENGMAVPNQLVHDGVGEQGGERVGLAQRGLDGLVRLRSAPARECSLLSLVLRYALVAANPCADMRPTLSSIRTAVAAHSP